MVHLILISVHLDLYTAGAWHIFCFFSCWVGSFSLFLGTSNSLVLSFKEKYQMPMLLLSVLVELVVMLLPCFCDLVLAGSFLWILTRYPSPCFSKLLVKMASTIWHNCMLKIATSAPANTTQSRIINESLRNMQSISFKNYAFYYPVLFRFIQPGPTKKISLNENYPTGL